MIGRRQPVRFVERVFLGDVMEPADPPYRQRGLGEYPGEMQLSQVTEMLVSPATALWLIVAVIAAVLLVGSLTRRRTGLTDGLREFVSRQQGSPRADVSAKDPADD